LADASGYINTLRWSMSTWYRHAWCCHGPGTFKQSKGHSWRRPTSRYAGGLRVSAM